MGARIGHGVIPLSSAQRARFYGEIQNLTLAVAKKILSPAFKQHSAAARRFFPIPLWSI